MTPTRILLVALPRMLEEIVSYALSAKSDIEIAGTARKIDGLAREVARTRPDVVVLGGDHPDLAAELLEQSPRLKVLAVANEGEDSWLYGLSPERTRLGALSPTRLAWAVQHAVASRGTSPWWNR